MEGDQGKGRRLLVRSLGDLGRVGWGRLPRDHDESDGVAINRLDGRNGHFSVADGDCLASFGYDRELASRGDERAANLEEVSSVAGQFGLEDGTVGTVGWHFGKEEHSVQLSREFQLLHASMLVDNSMLVLYPLERQQLVVVVDGKFGAIVSQVLDNLLVRGLFGLRVGSLEVGEAMVGCQAWMRMSVVRIGLVLWVATIGVRSVVYARVGASRASRVW